MLEMRARMYAQPETEMMPMLERIAMGPFLLAFFVSSVRCATASYPFSEV